MIMNVTYFKVFFHPLFLCVARVRQKCVHVFFDTVHRCSHLIKSGSLQFLESNELFSAGFSAYHYTTHWCARIMFRLHQEIMI